MNKEDDKKTVYNQMAWILNYQPKIEHQHIHMGNQPDPDADACDNVNDDESGETDIKEEPDNTELIEKLLPIFFNNEEDVRLFLKEITRMKDKDITDLVNKWVNDKRISDYGNSRKGDLWTILNDAGLYKKSRQNWCRRVY